MRVRIREEVRLFEKGEFEGRLLKNPLTATDRRQDNAFFKQFKDVVEEKQIPGDCGCAKQGAGLR
jgi:hypothetical protein